MSEPTRSHPVVLGGDVQVPEGRPPGLAAFLAPWFAFLGGAAAWVLHLVIAYAISEIACRSDRFAGALFGMPLAEVFGLGLTLLAGLTAIGAGMVAYGFVAADPRTDPIDDTGALETVGRRRFMGYVGLLMNGIFLLAILGGGLPFLYLRACTGS
jgi:hypothetical protein